MRRYLRFWMAYLPVPILGMWGVLFHAGWPVNHELFIHFERVEAFRRAYVAGDWFPTWTPFAENLHGDALPFFYHRLFNTIGSVFAVATGSSYFAVKISLYLVMLVGLWGMDRAVANLGGSRANRFMGACLVVFSNYSLTDWWIRGSTAEFTAFMLLPWFFAYLIQIIRDGNGGVGLGASTALVFYAHNAIFYFTLLMLVLVLAAHALFLGKNRQAWVGFVRQLGLAALACLVLAGPYAIAIAVLGPRFSLNALYVWSPIRQLGQLHWYFLHEDFKWGILWGPEIGRSLLLGLIVLTALVAAFRAKVDFRIVTALLVSFGFCMFLQSHLSIPFYRNFPGAMFLGFPWRLLCTITVAVVLLLCHLVDAVSRVSRAKRWLAEVLLFGALIFQAAFALSVQSIRSKWYPRADIEAHIKTLDMRTVGEYLPVQSGGGRTPIPAIQPFVAGPGCASINVAGSKDPATDVHVKRVDVTVQSPSGCDVTFNQFANPFLGVESRASIKIDQSPQHTIAVHVPPGTVEVTLFRRSLIAVVAHELVALLRR